MTEKSKNESALEATKRIGHNLLEFLNKPGVAPPFKPATMADYQAWQECCSFAMSLLTGETACVPGQLAKMAEASVAAEAKKDDDDGITEEVVE
jgi:hypothetical protein